MARKDLAPAVGGEFDVELALIDTSAPAVTSGVPELLGDYEGLGCTRELRVTLPGETTKAIACKLNPAEWMVPGMGTLGELQFGNLDFPDADADILSFNGKRCVAKVTTSRKPHGVVRSILCVDWTPRIEINAPEGDEPSTISASGTFARAIIEFEDITP